MRHKQLKLLNEYKDRLISYIQDNKLDITPEYMMYCITEADPDQQQFKNSKWLIKNLLDQKFLWEDIESGNESKAFHTLSRFLNIRKQWNINSLKDINQYVGLSGIAEKIRPFEIKKGSNELKREEKAKVYDETIVLYDKNDYLIVIPKTQEASCFWGRNTEWCTASTKSANYFDDYNKEAPLIICITPDNKKYQFHINSHPMDQNDLEIEDITDPMLIQLAILTGKLKNISKKSITPTLCEIAIKQNGMTLEFIPNRLKTPELCEMAVKQNGEALEFVPWKLKNQKLCEISVKQNGRALSSIPEGLKTQELCKLAIQNNGEALVYISDKFKTPGFCELAVKQNGMALTWVSKELITPELCKIAVEQNGNALYYVPIELRTPELCEQAIIQDGLSLSYVPRKLQTLELCKLAVQQNGRALCYVPAELITSELCELAIKQNGWSLYYVPREFKTPELCELSVRNHGAALLYVPDRFRTKELCELAIKQDSSIIDLLSKIEINNYDNLLEMAKLYSLNDVKKPQWLINKEDDTIRNILESEVKIFNNITIGIENHN